MWKAFELTGLVVAGFVGLLVGFLVNARGGELGAWSMQARGLFIMAATAAVSFVALYFLL